ncbi:MAG: hypothetical protein O2931_15180 [Planctomycetota bacterium]|nr:hypothetical protein [Planctomycetota bacterium]MDA1180125.1 hypothetical protein [Planctomycetota bacterium]
MNGSHLFSVFLLVLSAGMMWFHVSFWRSKRSESVLEAEHHFFWRQFLRRTGTSGLIGIIGLAVLASHAFTNPTTSGFYWYWAGLMAVVIVLGILALADMRSTHHYSREVLPKIVPHRFPTPLPEKAKRPTVGNGDH